MRWSYGLNCVWQNRSVEVLTHSSWDCDLIKKQDLYRDKQVKMRLTGWALIQYDWYPYKRGKFGHRDRLVDRKKAMWRWRIGVMQSKNTKDCQQTTRSWEEAGWVSEAAWPCWWFDFELLASITKNKFLFFSVSLFVPLCYGSPKKLSALPLLTFSQIIKIIFWLNRKTSKTFFWAQSATLRGMGSQIPSLSNPFLQVKVSRNSDIKADIWTHICG